MCFSEQLSADRGRNGWSAQQMLPVVVFTKETERLPLFRTGSSSLAFCQLEVSQCLPFQRPKLMQHSKINTSQQLFFRYLVSVEAMCWGSPSLPEKGPGETSLNWTKSELPNSMLVFCRILGTFYWFPLCATEHKFLHGSQTALLHHGVWSPLSTSVFWTDKSVFPIYGGEKMKKGICEDFANPFFIPFSLQEKIFKVFCCWIPL